MCQTDLSLQLLKKNLLQLYAASQSLFNKSAPSSSPKNEATISPDIIRPLPKAQPRKPASKGRKKGKSRILTDTPNKEEIGLIKSNSLVNTKKQRKCVKQKLFVEKSEDKDDKHMSCRYSSYEDVNMQMLLEQEKGDEIIEEDEIPMGTEKTLREIPSFGNTVRDVGQYVVFTYENELFPGKIISYDDQGATVSSMKRTLKSWKWPEKEDILTYSWEDILGSISPPKQISSRGLFDVPELKMIS
jgi:hypothetical protein